MDSSVFPSKHLTFPQPRTLKDEFADTLIVVRRRHTSDVNFARSEGKLQTLEGEVTYANGDAIVTGIKGEKWPIEFERFSRTYEPVSPLKMGEDGQYRHLPQTVFAHRLTAPYTVTLKNGRGCLRGMPGAWLVEYEPGDRAIVAADIFDLTYGTLE